jgi:peptidase E
MKKISIFIFIFLFLAVAGGVSAQQLELVYLKTGDININNPEISRAFYDELKGSPRYYFIDSDKDFELYINLLVPNPENKDGRYSANVFLLKDNKEQRLFSIDGASFDWQEYYESSGRDYYLKGPDLDKTVSAGKYKIEVYSNDLPAQAGNLGKYVLAVGKIESFDLQTILNVYWQLPLLKQNFFKTSVLQFFLTPFGIGGVGAIGGFLILIALINFLVGFIQQIIRHHQAKTLLLTSAGMQMREEIVKLLQKPAYDITVGFITTAAKPLEDLDFLKRDWNIMRDEMGFNVEEIDIDDKKQSEVMQLLELKDIIFVEGGNTFYLLNSMRKCNFKKVIKKLLREGKVYIGASAGTIVAGRNIKSAEWYGDKNFVHLKNFKGLNLVPFDFFVHYKPEDAEKIKKNMPRKWQRRKLKILTDDQAILVQGKEIALIGKGEMIIL